MKFSLFVWTLSTFTLLAQQSGSVPQPTASLFGRVINAQTRQPVHRAAIKIYRGNDQWDQFTDGDGRFQFPPIKRDKYGLVVHRDGYSDRAYLVEVSDFDNPKELPIELFPQAVITGRVADALGMPLQDARVEALPSLTRDGSADVVSAAATNDLGEYRLSGLNPGTYQIRATFRGGRESEFDPTPVTIATAFYGGAEKHADLLIKAGATTNGIDFVLNPVRPASIRGTVTTETGQLVDHAALWIIGRSGEGGHNADARDGKFEIADVGAGSYTISAETPNSALPAAYGIIAVKVAGSDVNGVEIVVRPSPKIRGRVQVEGADLAVQKLMVFFIRGDRTELMPMKIAHPDPSGMFDLALNPGDYTLTVGELPPTVSVQRATLDGKPILNWRLSVDSSADTKQLVIVLSPRAQR